MLSKCYNSTFFLTNLKSCMSFFSKIEEYSQFCTAGWNHLPETVENLSRSITRKRDQILRHTGDVSPYIVSKVIRIYNLIVAFGVTAGFFITASSILATSTSTAIMLPLLTRCIYEYLSDVSLHLLEGKIKPTRSKVANLGLILLNYSRICFTAYMQFTSPPLTTIPYALNVIDLLINHPLNIAHRAGLLDGKCSRKKMY